MAGLLLAGLGVILFLALLARGLPWGPGSHIQLTLDTLEGIRQRRVRTQEQDLVLAHTDAFLYGNVAADIVNFKNYGGMKNHCHNWNIQERLQARAQSDMERVFILGYLCHLAADVIAHNHFIPYHNVRGIPPLVLGHAYWEAMADATVPDEEWNLLAELKRNKALHQNDRLVWEAVRWRALGTRSNKWIFNNILLMNLKRSWRELVRLARLRRNRHPLDMEFLRHAWKGCLRNMIDVFDKDRLAVLKLRDPTGRAALRGARRLRKELVLRYGRTPEAAMVSRRLAREAYWRV